MVQTYSHSTCPTARLFLLKGLFLDNAKNIIITDSDRDIQIIEHFSEKITGTCWQKIKTLSDFWNYTEASSGTFYMKPHLLETDGSEEYLRRKSIFSLKRGNIETIESVIERLIEMGYEHQEGIDLPGSYKRTGSILQIHDPWTHSIWSIEWFDTEIDSLIEQNIRTAERNFRDIYTIKSRKEDSTLKQNHGSLNPLFLNLLTHTPPILLGCDFHPDIESIRQIARAHYSDFHRDGSVSLDVSIPDISNIEMLKAFLDERKNNATIRIYTKYEKSISDFLEFHAISGCSIIPINRMGLESCEIPKIGDEGRVTIILTDDILSGIFVRTRSKKSLAKNLDLLLALHPGDYIVHREHGIGRFDQVIEKTLGNTRREYLELHYAEGDKLFVPLTEIYRVSKYVGENNPELTRLSGKEWERTLEKTDEELEKIANELIEIASKRTLAKGIMFGKFPKEETEFQSQFPYEYTIDQRTAIEEIFRDMESENPMDRLLSGDVGFGKTEVAMNAIFKAILSGYQVAVISPLLVLADEHYETFCERFAPFGISVRVLTRMTSAREVEHILEAMKQGTVDLVVGTHRLLSADIRWKRLGLLVIDEEHKFGVSHKEQIKKMRANVDILSLSATPIPRSLNLALSGLKKISLLTTPPKKKKPIETIVSVWNESTIGHAIRYEQERGGQIIIIHNRINGMEQIEKEIESIIQDSVWKEEHNKDISKESVSRYEEKLWNGGSGVETVWAKKKTKKWWAEPEEASFLTTETFDTFGSKSIEKERNSEIPSEWRLSIITTHGRMDGDMIEDRIHAFKKGEYDILLTTTIIENGVNFLRANTIIILDPEDFGLAQLHQLRGRVGRKGEQGYCYLIYRKWELASNEKERIITIANNSHLGAGFEIAMRDMEIRGAGDVLGFKQAGKSKEVGLTLYFRMLEEKIETIKNEKRLKKPVKIDLDIDYSIPEDSFLSDLDKLNFYREIENIETSEELDEVESSFIANISNKLESTSEWASCAIFDLLRARLLLSEYGIESVKKIGMNYTFDFYEHTPVEKLRAFLDRFDSKHDMVLLSVRKIRVETKHWNNALIFLRELLSR